MVLEKVNSSLNQISDDFNLIKLAIKDVWVGPSSDSFEVSFKGLISTVDKIYDSIGAFNCILSDLKVYKDNVKKIEDLQAKIDYEYQHPSVAVNESYSENGVVKTRVKYVVNQSLIDDLEAKIKLLVAENAQLKEHMRMTSDYITDLNIKSKNNGDISHRGYRFGGITDNSVEAFINAGENGFWGCETDVRFDANGNLICSHNTPKTGENPPTFEEYLDICKKYGMTAIIDLKYAKGVGPADPYLSPAVIKTIEEKGMIDSCIIQTNNHTDIPYIRQTSSNARIWYLTDGLSENSLKLMIDNGVECVNTKSGEGVAYRIKKLQEYGIDTCVWNVQTMNAKQAYLNMGAKHVMTDNVLGITPYQEGEEDFNNIS